METALAAAAFPSAVTLAARDGQPFIHHAWGEARRDTIYDIASLTKAVATSLIAMRLYEQKQLSLTQKIRYLLAHASGLPAHRRYFETLKGREAIEQAASSEKAVYPAGSRSLYSDIGFISLGAHLQRVGHARLDQLFRQFVAKPLGLRDTRFGPIHNSRVAPTASNLRGIVHDENARAMGGVAGHAGLFSTAMDLHLIAQSLVSAWRDDRGIVRQSTVRRFWRCALPGRSAWCLGWDRPSTQGSQAGSRLSRRAVGHLGFTGCSIWIDPAKSLWIILLTNRVYSDPKNQVFRKFRPMIHDTVMKQLLRIRS